MGYILRSLASYGWFGLALGASVGLGIGALALSFSLVASLLQRPLPYLRANELYSLWRVSPTSGRALVSPWQINAVEEVLGSGGAAAATRPGFITSDYELDFADTSGRPVRLAVTGVTWNYFDVVGVSPLIGRPFTRADALTSDKPVVIVSHAFWLSALGGEAGVVGRTIRLRSRLGERSHEVVGVMPPRFSSLYVVPSGKRRDRLFQEKLWVPIPLDQTLWANKKRFWGHGIIRLRPGLSLRNAQSLVDSIPLTDASPVEQRTRLRLVPLREELVQGAMPIFVASAFLAACLFAVVVIGFANSAGLRIQARAREVQILSALGATERRIRLIVLIEIVVIGIGGTLFGYAVATSVAGSILLAITHSDPHLLKFVDTEFLGTACIVSGLVAIVVTVFYGARQLRRGRLRGDGGCGTGAESFALVTQCAAGTILLAFTCLVTRGVVDMLNIDPGFRYQGVVIATVDLEQPHYRSVAARLAGQLALVDSIQRTAGVRASLSNSIPLSGESYYGEFIDADTRRAGGQAQRMAVAPGFFEILHIPILAGRPFNLADLSPQSAVAVVNEAWVARYSPGRNPTGRVVMFAGPTWRVIVGVVGDIRTERMSEVPQPVIYIPLGGDIGGRRSIVAVGGDGLALQHTVEAAIREVVPTASLDGPTYMSEIVEEESGAARIVAMVLLAMTVSGWLAALSGFYVLIAQAASSRRREMAIRVALGAPPKTVIWLLLRRLVLLSTAGTLTGLCGAAALTAVLMNRLPEIDGSQVWAYAAAFGLVITTVICTAYFPAYIAARADPCNALRALD